MHILFSRRLKLKKIESRVPQKSLGLLLFFLLIVNYLCNVPYQENIIPISPGNEIFDYSFFSICEGFRFLRWILGNNAFVFASSLNALTITNCFEEIWSDTVLSRVNRGLLFRHNQGTVRFSWRRTRLSILGIKAKLYIIKPSLYILIRYYLRIFQQLPHQMGA